ncbi:MAG: CehA/McbA family metallohydrolase [Chloroflexota bacterium]|nr:CehA/McbA family metallohydrolase [Chloroflexota bacterium]MDE2946033.1 CehA/McbA family metallohydrolase [Chloroflexota bacterium]
MTSPTILTPDSLPFAQPGRFYRGNLHGHSTNSDGRWAPAEYIRQYRQNGYDFVALTDHCMEQFGWEISDTREYRDDEFTTLIGAELHPGRIESGSAWHLLAVGLPLDFETHREGDTGASVARRAMEAGAFLAATHPNWYAFTVADFETLDAADAVECYNGGCDVECDRGYSWHFIDMLLHRGHRVGAIAVDDVHAAEGVGDFMRGWVYVKAESLRPEELLRALKAGHYYSSTGAQLHNVEFLGPDKLLVECSPARQILVTGESAGALRISGGGLRGAEFDLSDVDSRWLRVTVRDEAGGRAWTNPVWLG